MEGEPYGGVNSAHVFCRLGKTSCEDEYPEHHHQIFVPRTAAKDHHTVGNRKFARFIVFAHSHFCSVVLVGDEERISRCDDKDHHEWHFVESAPSNAQREEESDEHEDGTEGYESLTNGDFSHAA